MLLIYMYVIAANGKNSWVCIWSVMVLCGELMNNSKDETNCTNVGHFNSDCSGAVRTTSREKIIQDFSFGFKLKFCWTKSKLLDSIQDFCAQISGHTLVAVVQWGSQGEKKIATEKIVLDYWNLVIVNFKNTTIFTLRLKCPFFLEYVVSLLLKWHFWIFLKIILNWKK